MWRYTIDEINQYMTILNKESKDSKKSGKETMTADELLDGRDSVIG